MINEINQMSSRKAMGFDTSYVSSISEQFYKYLGELVSKPKHELINIVSSKDYFLGMRWAAGTILAMIGDPRINPFYPEMIIVPSQVAHIGSRLDEIDRVYEEYKGVGVKRHWLLKEYPKHTTFINEFKIAKYPVTNSEYLLFLKDTNHIDIPSSWTFGIYDVSKSNHPVYGILPESADAYSKWLSKKTNRNFRLPTEYEWEFVAAGVERNEYPWGTSFSSRMSNTLEGKFYTTTPVGIFIEGVSPFGCLDLGGNVEEYVADIYSPYPDGTAMVDDLGSEYRIARGGSFTRYGDLTRCRRRHGYYDKDIYVIGFRLAEDSVK